MEQLRVMSTARTALQLIIPLQGSPAWSSASYLRDRVGVPRDLDFPAARQLRAHLTWAMEAIQA